MLEANDLLVCNLSGALIKVSFLAIEMQIYRNLMVGEENIASTALILNY